MGKEAHVCGVHCRFALSACGSVTQTYRQGQHGGVSRGDIVAVPVALWL